MLDALSNRIIGCALAVANTLDSEFLEKVYENALTLELRQAGLAVVQQYGVSVLYKGTSVGEYFVDLLVADAILIELKAVRALDSVHRAQCVNSLRKFLTSRLKPPIRRATPMSWCSCTWLPMMASC